MTIPRFTHARSNLVAWGLTGGALIAMLLAPASPARAVESGEEHCATQEARVVMEAASQEEAILSFMLLEDCPAALNLYSADGSLYIDRREIGEISVGSVSLTVGEDSPVAPFGDALRKLGQWRRQGVIDQVFFWLGMESEGVRADVTFHDVRLEGERLILPGEVTDRGPYSVIPSIRVTLASPEPDRDAVMQAMDDVLSLLAQQGFQAEGVPEASPFRIDVSDANGAVIDTLYLRLGDETYVLQEKAGEDYHDLHEPLPIPAAASRQHANRAAGAPSLSARS